MTESPQQLAEKYRCCVLCGKFRLPHKRKARKHGVCEFFFCPKPRFDVYFDAYFDAYGSAKAIPALFERCAAIRSVLKNDT